MGAWGPSLYANDFAEDLQGAIKALLRLPLDPEQLIDLLRKNYSEVADDPRDEDHTTFWLVLADKFHSNGIDAPSLYRQCHEIIDSGRDLQMAAELGMSESDIRKRSRILGKLKEKLNSPLTSRVRKTLKGPESFVMNVGEFYVYPISSSGEPRNPYMSQQMIAENWRHEAWGAMLIIETGRVFDFLAWYRPIVLQTPRPLDRKPDADSLRNEMGWRVGFPGTCSKAHHKKMQLEIVGNASISAAKVQSLVVDFPSGDEYALNDISISNELDVRAFDHHVRLQGIQTLTM